MTLSPSADPVVPAFAAADGPARPDSSGGRGIPACRGLLPAPLPGRAGAACTRTGGHRGDHRAEDGLRWNDERWLE